MSVLSCVLQLPSSFWGYRTFIMCTQLTHSFSLDRAIRIYQNANNRHPEKNIFFFHSISHSQPFVYVRIFFLVCKLKLKIDKQPVVIPIQFSMVKRRQKTDIVANRMESFCVTFSSRNKPNRLRLKLREQKIHPNGEEKFEPSFRCFYKRFVVKQLKRIEFTDTEREKKMCRFSCEDSECFLCHIE